MQVHCKLVHHHNFFWQCANNFCKQLRKHFMIAEPGLPCMKMSFHTKAGPVFQFVQHIILRGFWLQPKRIAGKVNAFIPVDDGDVEFIPEMF